MSNSDGRFSSLRAFFSRSKRKSVSTSNEAPVRKNKSSESLPQDARAASTARRKFVPRHAARDMVLSMPVEQRPNLVVKAREEQRQTVLSEIGFNTSLPSSNVSIRSGSSRARSTPALSTHPNLQMSRMVATERILRSQASGASLRSSSSSIKPALPRTPSKLHQMASTSDLDFVPPIATQGRPAHHSSHEPARPGLEPNEHSQRDLGEPAGLALDGGDENDSTESTYTKSTPPDGDPASTTSFQRPPRQYFSHNTSLPNLRANPGNGKGKERAHDSARNISVSDSSGNSASSYDSRDAYVIRTVAQSSTNGLAPPVPGSRGSRGSSVAGSTDSRFNSDLSFVNGSSTRAGSLSTAITEHTEYEAEREQEDAAADGAEEATTKQQMDDRKLRREVGNQEIFSREQEVEGPSGPAGM